jgi:hypothetical protein
MIAISIANSVGSRRSSAPAVVVPVATAATGVGETSFTANWDAFAGAEYYLLDVSTSPSFSSFVLEDEVVLAPTTSYVVIGLTASTTYYYRLRASTDPYFDTDYQAVLDYATTQGYTLPTAGQQTLQNQLLLDLKDGGIWSKLDTFGVFATDGDSDFALIDWKRLTDYTAINSPTFTTNFGFEGDNISSYIDCNYNVLSGTNWTQNSASFGYYMYQGRVSAPFAGDNAFGTGATPVSWLRPTSPTRTYINSISFATTASYTWDAIQFTHLTRTDSTSVNLYVDGALNTSLSVTSSPVVSGPFFCFKDASTRYNECGLSMVFAGGSLDAEDTDLYTAWNTYYTSL